MYIFCPHVYSLCWIELKLRTLRLSEIDIIHDRKFFTTVFLFLDSRKSMAEESWQNCERKKSFKRQEQSPKNGLRDIKESQTLGCVGRRKNPEKSEKKLKRK